MEALSTAQWIWIGAAAALLAGVGIGFLFGRRAARHVAERARDLEERLAGTLVRPDDPGYDVARAVYNAMIDAHPAAVVRCTNTADVVATCDYGGPVPAAIARGRLWATQFHPEKSGTAGLRVLANFVASLPAPA